MLTDEQLERRRDGVGGSDAPIIVGLSKRCTALELYYHKRGELPDENEPDELQWLGHEIEPVIAKRYTHDTGRHTVRCNRTLLHPEFEWMLAHIDRRVKSRKPKRGLEMKLRVHGDDWGPTGTDQVPDDVLVQCEHYLGVTGWEVWDVMALIGGREFRLYEIPRDQGLIDNLITAEHDFIARVREGNPPELDHAHPTARDLLRKIYPGTDGRTIDLGDDAMHWHKVRLDAAKLKSRYQRIYDEATAHIEEQIGTGSIGMLPTGDYYNRKRVRRSGHTVQPTSYIDFRFQKGAKAQGE